MSEWEGLKYNLKCKWNNFTYNYFRRFWYKLQRAWKYYGDDDVWSFDNYLSNVIWRGLEELKRTSHGYVLINPKKSNRWNEKKWNKILDKIIKGFKKYSKDGITYARLIREDGIKEDPEWTEAKKLFIKYFENFWD